MKRRILRLLSRTRQDQERELDEEIETHLQLRAADLEATGLAPEEAYSQAVARFGDLDAAKRTLYVASARRDRRLSWTERFDDLRRDLTISLRRMRTKKTRTAMMLLIFALGIGTTTAMFTVVDNVLLRALPFSAPHELVELQSVGGQGTSFPQVSMGNWFDWQASESLTSTGLYRSFRAAVATDNDVIRVDATETGGAFFEALRPQLLMGRPSSKEDGASDERVVVVSEGYWRRMLSGDGRVLGQTIIIDGKDYEVIGVLARGSEFPKGTELWTTRRIIQRTGGARNNVNFYSLARLNEGVSIERAKLELDAIAAGIMERDPEGLYSHGVGVVPLKQAMVAGSSTSLKLLMASVVLVLLIACVNLMGLTLAEGRERSDEVAVRLALGSGRRRLMQQLLTEQMLFGLIGGALGLLLAWWGTKIAVARVWTVLPRADEIVLDARVALTAIALSIGAGLVSGLLPAWRISGGQPAAFLSRARVVQGGRGMPGASLVIVEIALTVVLLTSGGLLIRSLSALIERDLGFDPTSVVTMDVNLTQPKYLTDPSAVASYWDRLIADLDRVPGVEAVAVGTGIPTGSGGTGFISLPGDPRSEVGARYRLVSDDYFSTLKVQLMEGRFFGPEDTAGSQRVVIINQAMADRYWPNEEALGKSVMARSMESYWYGGTAPWLTVVGVVADIRQFGFEDDLEPAMFTLYRQIPQMGLDPAAVVRVRPGDQASMAGLLKDVARSIDPELAVETGLLEARLHGLLSERKLVASIILGFAAMALALASLGIYGLLAFAVTARTPELAIRAALGAGRRELVALVLRGGLVVVAIGAALGALGVVGTKGLLQSMLVDVRLTDPATYFGVGTVLALVALAAILIPASRAARLNPTDALRRN